MEQVKSPSALQKVASALDLGNRWGRKYGSERPLEEATMLRLLSGGLELRQSRNTGLIEVRFYSDSALEAAQIANTVAETYCALPPGNRGKIVDFATPPARPVKPKMPLNIMLGAGVGAVSGIFTGTFFGVVAFWRLRKRSISSGGAKEMPILTRGTAVAMAGITAVFVLVGSFVASRMRRPEPFNPAMPQSAGIQAGSLAPPMLMELQLTKTIELNKVTATRGDRIAAWTDSSFPAGEAVVAVVTKPDGSSEDATTETITIRGQGGTRTTTVFSWQIPPTFDWEGMKAAQMQMQSNFLGKQLLLSEGAPLLLFGVINSAGGWIRGSLEFRPVRASEINAEQASASVRISSATNVAPMVLAYFTSSIPRGHVLEACGFESNGLEGETHTSISRAAGYDNENCRWDFPGSFGERELQAAVDQIKEKPLVSISSGQRTRVFSVTNEAGAVY